MKIPFGNRRLTPRAVRVLIEKLAAITRRFQAIVFVRRVHDTTSHGELVPFPLVRVILTRQTRDAVLALSADDISLWKW